MGSTELRFALHCIPGVRHGTFHLSLPLGGMGICSHLAGKNEVERGYWSQGDIWIFLLFTPAGFPSWLYCTLRVCTILLTHPFLALCLLPECSGAGLEVELIQAASPASCLPTTNKLHTMREHPHWHRMGLTSTFGSCFLG